MYPQPQLAGKFPPQRFQNLSPNLTSTAKSGGTLTLTQSSDQQQRLTGTSSHIVVLPDVSSLVIGTQFDIENDGTSGTVTVRSSGLNDIVVLQVGISAVFSSVAASGTGSDVWSFRQKTVPEFNVGNHVVTAAAELNLAPNDNYRWFSNAYDVTDGVEFNGTFFTCITEGWYAISLISTSSFQPVVIEWLFSKPTTSVVTGVSIGATTATFTCNNSFTNLERASKVEGSLIDAYNFKGMQIKNVTATSFDIDVSPPTTIGGASNGLDIANVSELWTEGGSISGSSFPSIEGQISVTTSNGPQTVNYQGFEDFSLTISSTSNGIDLTLTSNVYVTLFPTGFPSSGETQIQTSTGWHVISYTGITGTTTTDRRLTGVSGGTGIMSTNGLVRRSRFRNLSTTGSGILTQGDNIELSMLSAPVYTTGGIATSSSSDYSALYSFTGYVNGLLSTKLKEKNVLYLEFGDKFYFRNGIIWTIDGGRQSLRIESLF